MARAEDQLEECPKASINKNRIRQKEEGWLENELKALLYKNKDKIKEITIRGKHVQGKGWKLNINLVRK